MHRGRHVVEARQHEVEFIAPPVVEVALSVSFRPVKALNTVQLIDLWTTAFRGDYPEIQEQPPFVMPTESIGAAPAGPSVSFQLSPNPVSPRYWLLDEQQHHLIQLQQDFFAFNWRKLDESMEYPRYSRMREQFAAALQRVADYLEPHDLGEFIPTQAEITYINHVSPEPGEAQLRLRSIISGFATPDVEGLPDVETERLALTYRILHGERQIGRLHVAAEPAVRRKDSVSMVALSVTARGLPMESSIEGVLAFLDFGSEVAMDAFVGLTSQDMHARWGRK